MLYYIHETPNVLRSFRPAIPTLLLNGQEQGLATRQFKAASWANRKRPLLVFDPTAINGNGLSSLALLQ